MCAVPSIQHAQKKSLRLILLAGLFGVAQLGSVHAHTLNITDDVYVDMKKTTTNFGSKPTLIVRNTENVNNNTKGSYENERHVNRGRRIGHKATYVNFTLATLPTLINASDIEKATLRIWVTKVDTPGPLDLHLVNSPWDETC